MPLHAIAPSPDNHISLPGLHKTPNHRVRAVSSSARSPGSHVTLLPSCFIETHSGRHKSRKPCRQRDPDVGSLDFPFTSFYVFIHMHTQSQTLTSSDFINRALFNLFSSATVLDWLALDARSHNARAIGISSTWFFVCWCWGSKCRPPNSGPGVCTASTLSTAISLPFSPFLLYSSAARMEGKTSLCSQLVQNVPVLK